MNTEKLNDMPKDMLIELYLQQVAANGRMSAQLDSMSKVLDSMQEQLRLLTQHRFGRKTEQLSQITSDQLCFALGDDIPVFNEADALTECGFAQEPDIETITYKRKRPKGKRELDLQGLKVVIDPTIELAEADLQEKFPYGYHRMPDEIYRDLEHIREQFIVHEHHIAVYAGNRDTGIIRANRPERLLKNSILTTSLAAAIIDKKYVNHLPGNRISDDFLRSDVVISRQVIAGWMIKTTDRYLRPVYRELHRKILESKLIHCDETPFVLVHDGKGANSKNYMWVYHTKERYDSPPIYVYEYQPGRSQRMPKEFLTGYQGYLLTDGYQVYHSVSNERPDELKVAGCWAHAKRYFADIVKSAGAKASKGTIAEEAVTRIAAIYHVDNMAKGATNAERLLHRKQSVKPLVDSYFAWAKSIAEQPNDASSKTIQGIHYSINQEKYLRVFLSDGMVPLDNNDAERSIKNFCVGKHSWHIIDSKNGAEASAILYSIAETVKANGLKPYEYFKYLLDFMLQHLDDDPAGYLEQIMPWSAQIPDECKKRK